jgi:hypothetical protein
MESVYRVIAGLDVHKMLAVVVRQTRDAGIAYEQRKFGDDSARNQPPVGLATIT